MAADGYGFVYALGNELMPGLFKIGHTKYHPAIRAKQLSGATGCPIPFNLLAFFSSEIAHSDEVQIHEELKQYRVNDKREFFEVPPNIILTIFEKYSLPYREATFFMPLSNMVALIAYEMEE